MPERGPNDRGGRRGEVAGVHQPGLVGGAPGLAAEAEGGRHRDGIGGLGDGGVVVTPVPRPRGCRRSKHPSGKALPCFKQGSIFSVE